MCQRNLHIILAYFDVHLHPLHELIVPEEYLALEIFPRRSGLDSFRHKLRVTRLRHAAPLGELGQQTVNGQPRRCLFQPYARTVTAPWPDLRLLNYPVTNWIEHDVTRQFQQIGVAVHQNGLEASLKQMPHASMAAIAGLGVTPFS